MNIDVVIHLALEFAIRRHLTMGFLLEKTTILNIFTAQSCARGQAVFVLETLYIFEPEISNKQASKTKFS